MDKWTAQGEARWRRVSTHGSLRATCSDCRNRVWVDDLRAWERLGSVCPTCYLNRMQAHDRAAEARAKYAEG